MPKMKIFFKNWIIIVLDRCFDLWCSKYVACASGRFRSNVDSKGTSQQGERVTKSSYKSSFLSFFAFQELIVRPNRLIELLLTFLLPRLSKWIGIGWLIRVL